MEEYVNFIISTAQKLHGIGFKVADEWIGTLLLAGLPVQYGPMIMGIESSGSGCRITNDAGFLWATEVINFWNVMSQQNFFMRTLILLLNLFGVQQMK